MIDINELRKAINRHGASIICDDELIELLDRLEAAEEERDEFKRACFAHISDNSILRAKIEQMERQEPVAFAVCSGWARKAVYLSELEACDQRDRRQLTADLGGSLEAYRVVPLYALPGAKGEEK